MQYFFPNSECTLEFPEELKKKKTHMDKDSSSMIRIYVGCSETQASLHLPSIHLCI